MTAPKLPGIAKSTLIEWHAATIRDPIDRLRYVRGRVDVTPRPRRLKVFAVLGLLLSAAIISPTIEIGTGAAEEGVSAEFFPHPVQPPVDTMPRTHVWLVEANGEQQVYSNGLRIENKHAVRNEPRAYSIFPRTGPWESAPAHHTQPAGIVFHTTEGEQIPLQAERNGDLRHVVRETLEHVRRNRSYHFVIDKFGRVFRIVAEEDVAFHAGKSVWVDENGIYVSLNDSFLGVAFEAQTLDISDGSYLTKAQVSSGRLLVDMLIDKYRIPVSNCAAHSQVSVNPDNMKIGSHTDAAGDFPFEQMGLPDNYAQALPSVYVFGFEYDLLFLKATGFRLWKGLLLADERVREGALAQRLSIREYKAVLRSEYRKIAAVVELQHTLREKG